jgi:hypothetical protein
MNPIIGDIAGKAFDTLNRIGDKRPLSSSFFHTVTGVVASKYPLVGAAFLAYQIKDYTTDRNVASMVGDLGEFATGLILSRSQR